ncbi:uncharacterized protein LOC129751517 [Uranotaenia lowii]|uniref:uncharacterized protein LOC129751517 n=1 Tax=Uranotaenia lowii TaxID=190385 RepID=UPI00247AE31C|nr:uncharacterized protein LOC129751517 [Uranotaenia lowii]
MPCFCQFFNKNKQYKPLGTTDPSEQENSSPIVFASEMVQLKAEIWTLRNSLADTKAISQNLQDSILQTVMEKYEILDELSRAREEIAMLEAQQQEERNVNCSQKKQFLQEISSYRTKISELSFLVDKLSEDNIQLKKELLEANDTVYKIGQKIKNKASSYV